MSLGNLDLSWLVRYHLQAINPSILNNLLHLLLLEIIRERFTPNILEEWQVIEHLREAELGTVDLDLLLKTITNILGFPSQQVLEFVDASCRHFREIEDQKAFVKNVMQVARMIGYDHSKPEFAGSLTKSCLQIQPDNLFLLGELYWFYANAKNFKEAAAVSAQFSSYARKLSLRVFATYQQLYMYINQGNWLGIDDLHKEYKKMLKEFIDKGITEIDLLIRQNFILFPQPFLYIQDDLAENRWLQNNIARLFQAKELEISGNLCSRVLPQKNSEKLRIGYIAHTLRRHSVGWLSRWLIHYHDREKFSISIYFLQSKEDEITDEWFRKKADKFHVCPSNLKQTLQKIQEDEIEILVDLDSMTLNTTCAIMAHKPAPVQVTWLGMDASGIPNIDYFIADPYVLPENAQDHYQEKIWRLPQTYLAVDGFEIAVPTLRREHLNIPEQAVVYFSTQSGMKRHPNTIRLQMKIIKAVPDSYLIIKGWAEQAVIQSLFYNIATEEGVESDRLRFLGNDPSEEVHRANLAIADVVLDTYPYNGATTTLEVLWMGIPLVTRVGEQFAARNSYTFMVNAGIHEGIAWTDTEYVEWGIRLGTDVELRSQVAAKLHQGRRHAPLWDAQGFTQEMEKAYQQMWAEYRGKAF